MDTRNVADEFKGVPTPVVRETVAARSAAGAVAMLHLTGDFNISTVVRNANFFGMERVYYVGPRRWDKRGAVGTYHYTDVINVPDIDTLIAETSQYTLVALECNTGFNEVPLDEFVWPRKPLIIIGEESSGIPEMLLERSRWIVNITRHGSVRSINAGTASGIAMYSYRSRW